MNFRRIRFGNTEIRDIVCQGPGNAEVHRYRKREESGVRIVKAESIRSQENGVRCGPDVADYRPGLVADCFAK